MKKSAGILAYRIEEALQVFLVHPGGPYFRNKDLGAWTIPKGQFSDEENPLEAAKREFSEETGYTLDGNFIELKHIKQKAGKVVYAWAIAFGLDEQKIRSNTFLIEWPPASGKMEEFPEIDKAEWFAVEKAKQKINAAQIGLIDELVEKLGL